MRCLEVEARLPAYLEGELPADQHASLTAHLAACTACGAELSALEVSLAVLNAAAGAPAEAPDLWDRFQARLEAELPAADCVRMRDLLPAYQDAALDEPGQYQQVERHLAACAACSEEAAWLSGSLRALEQSSCLAPGGSAGQAPDLWAAFSTRLAGETTCEQAEELLPAYLAGEVQDLRAGTLRAHLRHCAPCAQAAFTLERSLGALDAAARTIPEIDLWPAFQKRLHAEEARRRRPAAAGWLPAGMLPAALLGAGRSTPLMRAAWAVGAVAAVALGLRLSVFSSQTGRLVPPQVAHAGAPAPSSQGEPKTTLVAKLPVIAPSRGAVTVPSRKSPPTSRDRRRSRLVMLQRGVRSQTAGGTQRLSAPLVVSRRNSPGHTSLHPDRTVRVARAELTPPRWETDDPQSMTVADSSTIQPQIEHFLEMLATYEDAASHPFGPEPNAH